MPRVSNAGARRGRDAVHVEFLVEEQSCAEALRLLLPKIGLNDPHTFEIHIFQGKMDLMKRLPERLAGYKSWLPPDWRIVVLVDRDSEVCKDLKGKLEECAQKTGFNTRSNRGIRGSFQVINRIAIEELEAWFFGDIQALCAAYPRVPNTLHRQAPFRDPDCIEGGTWERLEKVLQRAGHYPTGIPKIEVARKIAEHMDPQQNRSKSFCVFRDAMLGLIHPE